MARPFAGDTVLVAGQGPIGLMFARLLALRGMKVVVTDLFPTRLKLAREFGAVAAYCPACKVQSPKPKVVHRLLAAVAGPGLEPQMTQHAPIKNREFLSVKSVAKPSVAPALAELVALVTRGQGLDAAVIAVPSDAVVREAQALVRGGGQVLIFSHTRRGAPTSSISPRCVWMSRT